MQLISKIILGILLLQVACEASNNGASSDSLANYNIQSAVINALPAILHEVSGITKIDENNFGVIQDENGILFIIDANNAQIVKQYEFHLNGDYEGLTRVGSKMYVLRSDGVIFVISDFESENFKVDSIVTGIPSSNNEGLCYDADKNRLLIACKGKAGKGQELKDKRLIYGFDLNTKKLSVSPVFEFDVQEIKQFAIDHNVNVEIKTKKKGQVSEPDIKFMTSGICIHPVSKKLYLLSARDHMLFIFDMNGKVENITKLDPELFNKSEGIAFLKNGDMFITNEGQNKMPTLIRLNYLK